MGTVGTFVIRICDAMDLVGNKIFLLVREKFTFQNLFKITFVIWHGTV
jgi:hypothetical protein